MPVIECCLDWAPSLFFAVSQFRWVVPRSHITSQRAATHETVSRIAARKPAEMERSLLMHFGSAIPWMEVMTCDLRVTLLRLTNRLH